VLAFSVSVVLAVFGPLCQMRCGSVSAYLFGPSKSRGHHTWPHFSRERETRRFSTPSLATTLIIQPTIILLYNSRWIIVLCSAPPLRKIRANGPPLSAQQYAIWPSRRNRSTKLLNKLLYLVVQFAVFSTKNQAADSVKRKPRSLT
jgi:hypothetical protein